MAKEDDGNSEIMMTPRKKPHRILKIFANPLIMPQHILLYVECQGKKRDSGYYSAKVKKRWLQRALKYNGLYVYCDY
ncbi:MAG: hypothetical protein AAB197_00145, partial [Deltaproteobacteria bacterium]